MLNYEAIYLWSATLSTFFIFFFQTKCNTFEKVVACLYSNLYAQR